MSPKQPSSGCEAELRPQSSHSHYEEVTQDSQDEDSDEDAQGDQRVTLTDEDNRRIRCKTDKVILSILVWVYFLQILDKTTLGYAALFGLQQDTHLVGNQYSLVGSIAPIAQLAWQPFSSVLIVKLPPRVLMPLLLFGWGVAQAATAACRDFPGLLVDRFFLGLFEAGCLPLFSVITGTWYRRGEQPVRVAAWYGTNGLATIVAAGLSYGLGKIDSQFMAPWQIIFLVTGLMTISTVPFVYRYLDNSVASARFLTAHERLQARERLRANQSGYGPSKLKWAHVVEAFLDAKTYWFVGMALANNLGAQVTNTFGPLILAGFGYDRYTTSLLNMPFGALQWLVILGVAYAAAKWRFKSLAQAVILVPILAGLVLLYVLPRNTPSAQPGLLVGYYLLAFIFGGNTLLVSWILANTAGGTKKAILLSLYQAAASAGNVIGPLMFSAEDAPAYLPGLRKTLGVFAIFAVLVGMQVGNLWVLNRTHERKRVANGKPACIVDSSMTDRYVGMNQNDGDGAIGGQAFADLTDRENEEFIYVY